MTSTTMRASFCAMLITFPTIKCIRFFFLVSSVISYFCVPIKYESLTLSRLRMLVITEFIFNLIMIYIFRGFIMMVIKEKKKNGKISQIFDRYVFGALY